MCLDENDKKTILEISKQFHSQGCNYYDSFSTSVQFLQLKAIQEQTEAIKELTIAIKKGLGVVDDLPNDHPMYKTPESW